MTSHPVAGSRMTGFSALAFGGLEFFLTTERPNPSFEPRRGRCPRRLWPTHPVPVRVDLGSSSLSSVVFSSTTEGGGFNIPERSDIKAECGLVGLMRSRFSNILLWIRFWVGAVSPKRDASP